MNDCELHVDAITFERMQRASLEADLHGVDRGVAAWRAARVSSGGKLIDFPLFREVKVINDLDIDPAFPEGQSRLVDTKSRNSDVGKSE